jgi:hypothetical protein
MHQIATIAHATPRQPNNRLTHRNETEEMSLPADTLTGVTGAADVLAGIDEVLEGSMFHFPDGQQPQPDQGAGDRLVSRIMAAEYNLAVQRQGAASATPAGILALIVGQLLTDRESR